MEQTELTRLNRLLDTTGAPRKNANGHTLSFEARLQWVVDNSGLTQRAVDGAWWMCKKCSFLNETNLQSCGACETPRN